jgi:hypothetical protein
MWWPARSCSGPSPPPLIPLSWSGTTRHSKAVRQAHPSPPQVARILAMTHTCMYDAWAAYDPVASGTQMGNRLHWPAGRVSQRGSSAQSDVLSTETGDCQADTSLKVRHGVGKIEAAKASNFNKEQEISTGCSQKIQYQSVRNNKFQQVSIPLGIWFGTRGSEVQILSPRPIFSITYS